MILHTIFVAVWIVPILNQEVENIEITEHFKELNLSAHSVYW